MSTQWVADKKGELKQVHTPAHSSPLVLRWFARIISFIFHPVFIPLYLILFLVAIHPYLFAGLDDWGKLRTIAQVFINCTFLPLVAVMLLRGLKFIDSIYLHTQKDRIIPYVISMIFYFWNWYAFKNNDAATEVVNFSLAIFIASILGFLANIYLKVSMHAIAAGMMSAFIALLTFTDSTNLSLYLLIAILITGIVCTARMIVSDHSQQELYSGLFIGIASELLAVYFTG